MTRPHTRQRRGLILALLCLAGPVNCQYVQAQNLGGKDSHDALLADLHLEEAPEPVREHPGWVKPRRIVVRVDTPERIQWLRQYVGSSVQLIPVQSAAQARAAVGAAEGLIGYCEPDVIAAGSVLHWVQLTKAGAEDCLSIPAVRSKGLVLSNLQRVHGPAIAEHVMAMLLAFTRGLYRYLPEKSWDASLVPRASFAELRGKTMLVVGLGGIGTEVARLSHALGMRVVATRASQKGGPPFVDHVGAASELLTLTPEADVIVNATPLTEATIGLFDRSFFQTMKPSAYFINVGRGKSVVTDDLVAALRAGHLAGAGLDVTDPEPLPWLHPLWRMDNVIITPHVAAQTDLRSARMWAVLRENLQRYVRGDPLLSVVDTERGY